MTEAKVNGQNPEEKLLALGIPEKNIASDIAILRMASSPEGLLEELKKRGLNCDEEQFLLPMFRPLYQRDLEIRKTISTQLVGLQIPENIINDYFIAYGDCPYIHLRLRENELDEKAKEVLIEKARLVMLNTLRNYLGFSSKNTAKEPKI